MGKWPALHLQRRVHRGGDARRVSSDHLRTILAKLLLRDVLRRPAPRIARRPPTPDGYDGARPMRHEFDESAPEACSADAHDSVRPTIDVTTQISANVDEAIRALRSERSIYQRGG